MFNLLTQSYWRDEAFSVLLSSRPLQEIFGLVARLDHTPPLYYYLQHFWINVFGSREIATRSLSLLFHLATVYFGYKLTQSRLVLWALLVQPFLWNYAVEARHYSAYAAFVLGGIYFFQAKKYLWSNLFWAMSLWTHNFSWLYFLIFAAVYRAKRLWPALILGAAWLPFALNQANQLNQGMWLGLPSGWLWWWESLKNFSVFPELAWLTVTVLAGALAKPKKLLAVALLPPLLAYLVSRVWVPVYLERYLLPSLPLLLIAGLTRWGRLGWFYVVVAVMGFAQINQQATKAPLRQAVQQISVKLQPDEIIITEQPINYLETYFYLQQSGDEDRLYSYLYPGEDNIPYYVGTELIRPWQEIVTIPPDRSFWLVKPDGSVLKYE